MKVRDAIKIAAHVATKGPVAILTHLRIEGRHVTACDLTQEIQIPVELAAIAGPGFCVHAARLARVLSALPEESELKLERQQNKFVVAAGATRYELNITEPEDFPNLGMDPDASVDLEIESKILVAALAFAAPAMAVGDIRFYLNGLHLAVDRGAIVITATDGNRLHRVRVPLEDGPKVKAEGVVHASTVARIIELADRHETVELSLSPTRLTIAESETLCVKLIDGKFPDAERVIPAKRAATGNVSRAALAESVKRVAQIYAGAAGLGFGMAFDFQPDHIAIDATTSEGERATERFEWTPADKKFESLQVGFRWNYIADALGAFTGERVNLHLSPSAGDALYLTDDADGARQVVVMPMRV
jgi:DNA polymerase-3 subunit beta